MLIDILVEVRLNLVIPSPIVNEIEAAEVTSEVINYRLIHAEMNYHKNMSDSFFQLFEISEPHHTFVTDGGTQAEL